MINKNLKKSILIFIFIISVIIKSSLSFANEYNNEKIVIDYYRNELKVKKTNKINENIKINNDTNYLINKFKINNNKVNQLIGLPFSKIFIVYNYPTWQEYITGYLNKDYKQLEIIKYIHKSDGKKGKETLLLK